MVKFIRRSVLVPIFLGALSLHAALPFPQDGSDLKPEATAQFGVLPNGVRYVIFPNHEPRNRASLRLLVLSGSLQEKDDQQGLAHFLEHMAFNGSAHFAPGTLVEVFQRLGMSFGGDTNAYTSFDHTAYKIELPDTHPATLAEGLQVFADMAGSLLLRPDMITKERPIILSEKRDRDSIDYRQFVASFQFLLPDARLPKRLPIGLQAVIEHAGRDRFVDLYNTWYRPERMAVIVVGEVDPSAVTQQITAAFGGLTDRAPPPPALDLGTVTAALGLHAAYDAEPEAPATTVALDVVTPYARPLDTAAIELGHLRRDLAVAMLNRRLAILSKKDGAAFTRAEAAIEESYGFYHDAGLNLTCTAAQWPAALAVGEQELRRALQFGFTPAELQEAVANFRNDLVQAVTTASTRRSEELADQWVDSLVDKTVFTSPKDDLSLLGPALDRMTPNDCADALRSAFGAPGRYVQVSGNAQIPGDAAAAIVAAYEASHAVAVQPPAAAADRQFAYRDFGPPGQIVSRRRVEDLDITEVGFANGVRVNLKKTPFEANRIRIRVRVGGGLLTAPKDEPGLAPFVGITFSAGGLGRHSADDLQRILAGKTVGVAFAPRGDALEFSGATNPADLLLELQLITAYLTDPGYRPEALRVARKEIDEVYRQLDHTTAGPLEAEVPRLLADGDPRFGLPPEAIMLSRTLEEEKAWLTPQFAHGPIEIGVVGDFDLEATLAALRRTVGALPPREPKPAYRAEREVHYPAHPFRRDLTVPTELPKASVALYWGTTDAHDIQRTRRLGLLGQVFDDRLRVKIREQLGGAYSPDAESEPSETFTDYGLMLTELVVAPERAAEIAQSIRGVADDMARNGVTLDQLTRAKEPVLTGIRTSARTNPYWLTAVVGSCQEFPQRLDWARSRQADIQAITKADLDALARQYLGADRAFQVIVLPQPLPVPPPK
jgi:zinc protease